MNLELNIFNRDMLKSTINQLDRYATKGLRTLVLGKRIIDKDIYTKWVQRYNVKQCFSKYL